MRVKTRRSVAELLLSVAGIFLLLYGVVLFNRNVLMTLPLAVRMVLMPLLQWIPALLPLLVIALRKIKARDLGFSREKIGAQLFAGLGVGAAMTLILVVFPLLMGWKDLVGSTQYTKPWQFAFQFFYCLLGVAFAEELIFRGYLFERLVKLKGSKTIAIIGSSVVFGLFHIFSGDLVRVFVTALLGAIWCVCREKIKYCTTLSLILAHGLYDASIPLCVFLLG